MLNIRTTKSLLFSGALLALILTIGIFVFLEHQYCMEVPLLQEDKLIQYTEVTSFDISQLRFNGEKVAVDTESNTIYISQSPNQAIHYTSLQGKLESTNPDHTLFFVKNAALKDIGKTIETGENLSLKIVKGSHIQSVDVVITTLPVIKIDGEIDAENRFVFSGDATLWCGLDPSTETSSVITSELQWRVRGNTTSVQPKNPWKLSFKNENGDKKDLNLLGLGEDDDWILNSLTMDDTRIKEKLFIDLWNTMAEETDYNYKMSSGEYVEVVINGKYLGLFLLQRRLDAKYLELSDEDVLLKATHYYATSAEEAYEFVTPKVNEEEIYAIMNGVLAGKEPSPYNLDNVIDVNLMLQMANARDNYSQKNIFHILEKKGSTYEHFLVPWDTDMSFGVVWKEGFAYDYAQSLQELFFRMETPDLQGTYPEYQQKEIERWNYLRQTILAEENILAHIDKLYGTLSSSSAIARDISVWSNRYGGNDTVSALKEFVCDRLTFLDEYYN